MTTEEVFKQWRKHRNWTASGGGYLMKRIATAIAPYADCEIHRRPLVVLSASQFLALEMEAGRPLMGGGETLFGFCVVRQYRDAADLDTITRPYLDLSHAA